MEAAQSTTAGGLVTRFTRVAHPPARRAVTPPERGGLGGYLRRWLCGGSQGPPGTMMGGRRDPP